MEPESIDEARKNPIVAKALFTLLLFGRQDAKTIRTIRKQLSAFEFPRDKELTGRFWPLAGGRGG